MAIKKTLKQSTISVHFEKHKSNTLDGMQRHNERKPGQKHKNKNIKPERTADNVALFGNRQLSYTRRVDDIIKQKYKGKRAVRRDAVRLITATVNLGEGVSDLSESEQVDVLCYMHDWLLERYPNVVSSTIHVDETTPHLHFDFVPILDDGRLSAKVLTSQTNLRKLQEESLKAVQEQFPLYRFRRLSKQESLFSGVKLKHKQAIDNVLKSERSGLEEWSDELDERQDELDQLEEKLDERQEEQAKKSQELSELYAVVENTAKTLVAKENDDKAYLDQEREKMAQRRSQELLELSQRETLIQTREKELVEKEKELEEKQNQLNEKAQENADKERQLKDFEERLNSEKSRFKEFVSLIMRRLSFFAKGKYSDLLAKSVDKIDEQISKPAEDFAEVNEGLQNVVDDIDDLVHEPVKTEMKKALEDDKNNDWTW